jgi:hypothetical protein
MAATRRLRDKMREDLELRGMSANTINTYVRCAGRFAEYHGRSPCTMSAPEIRAFLLSLVARRFGEEPITPPTPPARVIRPLLTMALENAIEGCVRETYSALECAWQGYVATDAVVRATMRRIARDELRHLAFSWAVHAWAIGRLDAAGRARVRRAQRDAIAVLKREVGRDPHESLLGRGGLPRAHQSQWLVDAIEEKVAA